MIQMKFENMLCLRLCGRYSQKYGWSHDGDMQTKAMIVLLESGECYFDFDDRRIEMREGDVLLIPKNIWYRPHTEQGCSYQYFHFEAEEVLDEGTWEKCGRIYHYCEPIPFAPQVLMLPQKFYADPLVKEAFSAAIDAMLDDSPESNLKMHLQFFTALVRLSEGARKRQETLADRIKEYMNRHALEKLSLAGVALHFGYTKQHVIRIFKGRFGMTPTEYLDQYRLEQGVILLNESDLTVDAIAQASGFDDANYFSRRFRKRYGITPREYRAKLRSGI